MQSVQSTPAHRSVYTGIRQTKLCCDFVVLLQVVQAQYDYNPRTLSPNPTPELELSFKEGEVITVYGDKVHNVQMCLQCTLSHTPHLTQMEDGFFLGQLGDKTGFVPSNFVTGLPSGDKNSTRQRGYRRQLFSTAAEHMIQHHVDTHTHAHTPALACYYSILTTSP